MDFGKDLHIPSLDSPRVYTLKLKYFIALCVITLRLLAELICLKYRFPALSSTGISVVFHLLPHKKTPDKIRRKVYTHFQGENSVIKLLPVIFEIHTRPAWRAIGTYSFVISNITRHIKRIGPILLISQITHKYRSFPIFAYIASSCIPYII